MICYQSKLEFQSDLTGEEDTGILFFKALKGNREEYAAIEKIALLHLEIKNCEDIIYTANIPEFDDPLN